MLNVLIFSGYNQRAVISFCRFLKKIKVEFVILARDSFDTILLSDYKSNVIGIRDNEDLQLHEILNCKNKIKSDKIIILPSSEYLNRFLLSNRVELENNGFIVPLCSKGLYEKISDKLNFSILCGNNGIMIPEELEFNDLSFPFVAKPKKFFSKNNIVHRPILVYDKLDLRLFFEKYDKDDFYFQRYVNGKSIYYLFYFAKNGKYSAYSQENLIQQSDGLSMIASRSSMYHKEKSVKKIANLFINLGFTGLVMVEVKKENDNIIMIEANPRMWGPSQLILDSDMDIFYKFCKDLCLIDKIPDLHYKSDVLYFWSGGIVSDQNSLKSTFFHDFSPKEFYLKYSTFIDSDIYLKPDTINIYLRESKKI